VQVVWTRQNPLTVNKNNTDAIAAYKKIGFRMSDLIKIDIGNGFFMDDFVMEYIVGWRI